MLEEIHEHGIGPLQVIDDEDERSAAGERLEDLPYRPEGLIGRDRVGFNSSAARPTAGSSSSTCSSSPLSPSASTSGHQVSPSP